MFRIRRLALAAAAGFAVACVPTVATAAPSAVQPTFTAAIPVAPSVTTGEVVAFDVDGDGLDDILHLSPSGDLTLRTARTRGRFRAPVVITGPETTGLTNHLQVYPSAGPGNPVEVVFAETTAMMNTVYRLAYDPTSGESTLHGGATFWGPIVDVHAARLGAGGEYRVAVALSDALFVLPADFPSALPTQTLPAPGGPIGSFDLDADGDLDLVAGSNAQRQFTQFRNTNGTFAAVSGLTQPRLEDDSFPSGPISGYATLDIGGDGNQDLVLTNHVAGDQSYLRLVAGTPSGQVPVDSYWYSGEPTAPPTPLLTGDFDGNGMDDIAWNYAGPNLIFFIQGSGVAFLEDYQGELTFAALQHQAGVGDLNGDGKSDILAISATRGIDLYLSNSGGDTVPPTITVDSAPPSRTNQTTATFAIDGDEENLVYECQVDGGAWIDCSATPTLPGLTEGSHSASIRAIDEAGNRSNVLTHSWTVDTTAPSTTIASGPPEQNAVATASFGFASDDGDATFECRRNLDGGDHSAWAACANPLTLTGLAEGEHRLEVRAVDVAGNADATPAAYSWTVDLTAPDAPTLTEEPPLSTKAPRLVFTGEDGSTFECRVDAPAPWVPCTSPFEPELTGDGQHTVEIRQVDAAGNTSDVVFRAFTLDTVAPDAPTLTAEPDESTNAPSFGFEGESGSRFECQVDDGDWAPCTSPFAPTDLADGPHEVALRQIDAAGNVSDVVSRTFTLDATAPDAPQLTTSPSGATNAPVFTFAGETGAGFECRIDDGEWVSCVSPFTPAALPDGTHRFELRQTDAVGNVSAVIGQEFALDTAAPAAPSVLGGPSGTVTSSDATFSFAGEPGSTFTCSLDGGPFGPCASPLTLTGLSTGKHHLRIVQTDAAGNAGDPIDQHWEVVAVATPVPPVESVPGPTRASVVVPAVSAARGATVPVGCRIDAGRLERCTVTAYLGGRVVGTGSARFTGDATRGQVNVRLNATGQRAIGRVGGAKLRFRVVANGTLRSTADAQVLPETTRSVPSTGMFPTASARMTASGQRYLRSVARDLRAAKAVTCIGHTDARGSRARNQRLGRQRAAAVCTALRRAGVKATQRSTSRGESQPRATNATAEGRALNRRVVLAIRYR